MKIQFSGAAGEVTGSKHLIQLDNGHQILFDCGMFQGGTTEEEEFRKNEHLGFDPSQVTCLILSHAHIDHSGLIPRLVKEGFKGPIYVTPATKDLCRVMLEDSAKIQREDAKDLNKTLKKQGKRPVQPLYEDEDVKVALNRFISINYDRTIEVAEGAKFHFTDAGHILGSAAINLEINENEAPIHLTFTGDIGRPNDKILRPPQPFPQADVLICESTYGDELHGATQDLEEALANSIRKACIEVNNGKLLIPAFSLDRTQDIVYMLDRLHRYGKLPNVKIYVDSPLATLVTGIMREHTSYFNDEILKYMEADPHPFQFENLYYTQGVEDSKALNYLEEPAVIISASGMMEGGRVKHHLVHHVEDPSTTLLLVGYSTPNSLGGKIQNGAEAVYIFGQQFQVNAHVESINGFSAHADYKEILDYISCQDPKELGQVFLVHGESDSLNSLKEKMSNLGYKHITVPEQGEEYEIFKAGNNLEVKAIKKTS